MIVHRKPLSASRLLSAVGVMTLLVGCAALHYPTPPAPGASEEVARCRALLERVDEAVSSAGVGDAQSVRIPGLPYLRIDRLLAHGIDVSPHGPEFDAWVDRLRHLDRRARRAEFANLGDAAPVSEAEVESCAGRLRRHDLGDPATRMRLAAFPVADDYRLSHRVLGLYPLTAPPFLLGVYRLHRETAHTFATPLQELPVHGQLRRLVPDAVPPSRDRQAATARRFQGGGQALGIPEPTPEELTSLLIAHAPIWEIDTDGVADRPGRPHLSGQGWPWVGGDPVVYFLPSYTRWQGRLLLQLNYVIWFPARPRTGPFDLVGGHLDGITWRVTLDGDGRPLAYDAMHNCGCYYMAFPTVRLQLSRRRQGWEEPIMVPQTVPDGPGRLVLRVSSGAHYIQRVYRDTGFARTDADATQPYELEQYDRLRSLPVPGGGRRSLFRPDGIVSGTERGERWLFWPMGVPEAGAMRQWGRHAIAFVGRRHFDDPDLIERYFEPREDGRSR
jgi:hypothetical protein